MPGLPITITNAGRAALINAQNTGSAALVVSQVGVSASHAGGDLTTLAALPGEVKRLATFAGDVVADDVLHLTIRDETADAYSLRSFALYLSNGVLFGVYSQAAPIMEKSAAAILLLAADVALKTLTTAAITFGETDFINPSATTETPGVIEIATQAEVEEGTDAARAVTPLRLKGLLTALLGLKSNVGHQHDAADVASGILAVARVPDLGMAKITGLIAALAGKSDVGHGHDAAAVTSGVLNILRVPDLAMSKITGLAEALAGKAAAAHTHVMADITGLAAALATKLAIADFTWANLVGRPNVAINGQAASFTGLTADSIQAGQGGVGVANMVQGTADNTGYIQWATAAGDRLAYLGFAHRTTKVLEFTTENGAILRFSARPEFGGALPWDDANAPNVLAAKGHAFGDADWNVITTAGIYDVVPQGAGWHVNNPVGAYPFGQLIVTRGSNSTLQQVYHTHNGDCWIRQAFNSAWDAWRRSWTSANFNPADKAAAIHSHDWAQVTGKPAGLLFNIGSCAEADLNAQQTSGFQTSVYSGHSRTLFTLNAGGSPGPIQQEWNYSLSAGGWRVRNMQDSVAWGTWSYVVLASANQGVINGTIYHSANFNPAGKSDVGHTHTTGQITDLLDVVWPAGELRLFDSSSVPSGARCLVANGATVSRSTYSRLFAVIGVRYGAGDGATTFQLPDWRGLFFRGLDNGRGVDAGRSLGTTQSSQNLGHDHTVGEGSNSQALSGSFNGYTSGDDFTSLAAGYSTTGSSGGSEARPINTALLACITY